MFNLVLNHHCLHIRKAGGQQWLAVHFNRTLINALRATINAQMAAKTLKKAFPTFCRGASQSWCPRRVLCPRRGGSGPGSALAWAERGMTCTFCTGRVHRVTGASGQTPLPQWRIHSPRGSPKSSCAQVGGAVSCVCPSLGLDGLSRRRQYLPHSQQWVHSLMFSFQQSSGSDFRLVYADWIGARTWKTPCLIDLSSDFIPLPHSL